MSKIVRIFHMEQKRVRYKYFVPNYLFHTFDSYIKLISMFDHITFELD